MHLAEEIVQEMALLVIEKKVVVEGEAQFMSWLTKTARFQALNALQKRSRAAKPLDSGVLDLLDEHWRASEPADTTAASDALRECLRTLTPRSRRLVDLRYGENLDGRRLAEILARPLNTIYVALSRIHRTLGECVRLKLGQEGISHA